VSLNHADDGKSAQGVGRPEPAFLIGRLKWRKILHRKQLVRRSVVSFDKIRR
jgi:hypothetical protein